MLRAFIHQWSGTTMAAALALLVGMPMSFAAESAAKPQQQGGLSDSAVRVMLTYAFSLIPDETPGPDGKPMKLDKSDPNIFAIPDDDARRVIRAATRSAYAEACELPDLAQSNYQALLRSERAKKSWTEPQIQMINALFAFSASYFVGNVKFGEAETAGTAATDVPKQETQQQKAGTGAPNPPKCPPEQKQKVVAAINAYVKSVPQSAAAAKPPSAPPPAPAQPAKTGSN